jgi:hypothetical protein
MLDMTPATSRVLLVPEDRIAATGPHAAKVRRYRLARLRLVARRDEQATRLRQRGFPLGLD